MKAICALMILLMAVPATAAENYVVAEINEPDEEGPGEPGNWVLRANVTQDVPVWETILDSDFSLAGDMGIDLWLDQAEESRPVTEVNYEPRAWIQYEGEWYDIRAGLWHASNGDPGTADNRSVDRGFAEAEVRLDPGEAIGADRLRLTARAAGWYILSQAEEQRDITPRGIEDVYGFHSRWGGELEVRVLWGRDEWSVRLGPESQSFTLTTDRLGFLGFDTFVTADRGLGRSLVRFAEEGYNVGAGLVLSE